MYGIQLNLGHYSCHLRHLSPGFPPIQAAPSQSAGPFFPSYCPLNAEILWLLQSTLSPQEIHICQCPLL